MITLHSDHSILINIEGASPVAQLVKNWPVMWETWVGFLGQEWLHTPVFLPEQLTHRHIHREVLFSLINVSFLLQEGRPLPGPESELLSNTWKWIVPGNTGADKARDFIGKGPAGGEHQGKGTQENCSAAWRGLPFHGDEVSFLGPLWPVSLLVPVFVLTQGPSQWYVYLSANMGSSMRVSGRLARHIMGWSLLPPFGPS